MPCNLTAVFSSNFTWDSKNTLQQWADWAQWAFFMCLSRTLNIAANTCRGPSTIKTTRASFVFVVVLTSIEQFQKQNPSSTQREAMRPACSQDKFFYSTYRRCWLKKKNLVTQMKTVWFLLSKLRVRKAVSCASCRPEYQWHRSTKYSILKVRGSWLKELVKWDGMKRLEVT